MVSQRVTVLSAIPTPPPYSGPEAVAELFLTTGLGDAFRTWHLRTNVNSSNRAKGRLSLQNVLALVQLWVRLLDAIRRHKPRLLHFYLSQNTTGFLRDAVLVLTAATFGVRVVAEVHGSNFGNFYQHASGLWQLFIRFVIQRLTGVILLAERFRSQFTALLPDNRIFVVRNAVAFDWNLEQVQTRLARQSFNILYMGHLSQAKGFGEVIKAAPEVLDTLPSAVFYFAGEWLRQERNILFDEDGQRLTFDVDATEHAWQELVARYDKRVRYLGIVTGEDKKKVLGDSDIFVLPSYSEGMPMAVLEAMAAGLALVVTPVGALPEILQDAVNARFVPPGDVKALAAALVDLACKPEVRRQMGTLNYELVRHSYTPTLRNRHLAEIFLMCAG